MSRRTPHELRCPLCEIHRSLCFCDQVPELKTNTQVEVIVHVREKNLTSNTPRLAARVLPGSLNLRTYGAKEGDHLPILDWKSDERFRLAILFPSETAVELSSEWVAQDKRPVRLIVPDGNWIQAGKIPKRIPGLSEIQAVKLPLGAPSRYRLRHTPREGGLSTFEAIARALEILEPGFGIQEKMEHLFDVMVERRLLQRGKLHPSELKYWKGVWGQ
jgi:DTW domain-containing protein YfiP